jgi:hypothetical protein
MLYLGVDPGQKGGLCLLGDDRMLIEYCKMPDGKKDIISKLHLWYEKCLGGMCIISERAQTMPKQGIKSAFGYGNHFGIFETSAYWMEIPYHDVAPQTWKKTMHLNSDKNNAIVLCEKIFPTVNLIPPKGRVKHDGIAEAILIAEWARRQNL